MNRVARGMDAEVLRTRLRDTGRAVLRMQGQSMSPLLPHGTQATLRPVARGEELCGAIVAIEFGEQVVVHKVIESGHGTVRTQGIASSKSDAPTPHHAVVGVVCERVGWPLSERVLRRVATALLHTRSRLRAVLRRR